jgi:hypothetical protein
MKRLFSIFSVITLLFSMSTAASAAYVVIGDGGDLILEGLSGYSVEALPYSFDLTVADGPRRVDFFEVTFESFDAGSGSATANIDFVLPEIDVQVLGVYGGLFTAYFQFGVLIWYDDYVDIEYGNNGLLRLALFDLAGLHIGDTVTIPGSIEILQESAPVPIPGTAWLLGSGLLGLLGLRRKNRSSFPNQPLTNNE